MSQKRTREYEALQRRLTAVREPLSMGMANTAAFHKAQKATRPSKAVSVLPAGIRSPQEMRHSAYQSPGAFFSGDLPKGMVPMPDWTEDQWTAFWKNAGWPADQAAAMAAGVQRSEFPNS